MWKKVISLFLMVCLLSTLIGCSGGNPVVPSEDETLDNDDVDTYNKTTNEDGLVILNLEEVQVEVKVEDGKSGIPLSDINVDIFLYEGKIAYLIVDPSGDYVPKIIVEEQSDKEYLPQSKIPIISTIVKLFERTQWALEGYTSGGAQFSDQIDNKFLKYLFDYIFQYGGKTTLGDIKYSWADAIIAGADVVVGTGITVIFTLSGPIGWALIAIDVFDMGDTFAVAQWAKKYESLGYTDNDQFEVYYWIPVPFTPSNKIPFYPFIVPLGEPGEFMEEEEECIPKLISPSNGAVLDNGCYGWSNLKTWNFDWSDCPGATCYHLYVRQYPNATIPIIDNNDITISNYTYKGYGYVIDINRFNWKWKVRAMVNGQWGPWSEERTFDVEPIDSDCTS